MAAHAILSASSADRWIKCPPSVRLGEQFKSTTSEYAEEGTLAHSICELKLRKIFTEPGMTSKTFNTRMNKFKKHELYKDEMQGYTDAYVDYVQQIAYSFPSLPHVALEVKLDYSKYAQNGFGTSDCIIIHGSTCHVIDFKYGKGIPVSAEGNPQMALYAIGALEAYSFIYPIDKVHLTIIQPRLSNESVWETNAEELRTWGEVIVKPAAALAWKGEGEYRQGDHCRWCSAMAVCRKRMVDNLSLEEFMDPIKGVLKRPPIIDNDEVGAILARGQSLVTWYNSLKAYALNAMTQKGENIPGWKLVEGRSNRAFTNQDAAFELLISTGTPEAMLYEKKPLTLTAVEGLIGKKAFAEQLGDLIHKPSGAPALAEETDKRPEFKLKTNATEDFGGANEFKED